MKQYRATITVNVFINAENEEEANDTFQDMEMRFTDGNSDGEFESDLIDLEIAEIGDVEDDEEMS
jgi:hypothetical protein